MSTHVGGSASQPAQPNGRQKKNSIGSWFSKKFGRRPSEAAYGSHDPAAASHSKTSGPKSAVLPSSNGSPSGIGGQQPHFASAFGSNQAQGLANTLTVPNQHTTTHGSLTPPPQLDGIPSQEPLGAIDLPRSPRPDTTSTVIDRNGDALSPSTVTDVKLAERPDERSGPALHPSSSYSADAGAVPAAAAAIPTATISSLPTSSNAVNTDSDDESSLAGRDSIGNRTMDTSKSRASTKPTTLMSLDTRESTVLPTTHIAQPRHDAGDDRRLSNGPREGSTIQFASNSVSRSGSGQIPGNASIAEAGSHFITVPGHSRPHPNNNPHPAGIPADNASVLTLASSTAGMSLGGAASSRGHYHAPSLGGARSIGGSLMGDRRNSSDTYASLKALPPLSRRGSDSSSRTRESVAASATGQNSHQAMYAPAGAFAGPGAPTDRVSLHRTPSQKTVATQMSVPLSASASNPALQAYAKSEHTANGSQVHLASQPAHVYAEPGHEHQNNSDADQTSEAHTNSLAASTSMDLVDSQLTTQAPSEGLLEAQASNLAATEHDKVLQSAAHGSAHETTPAVAKQEPFDVPGGPPVA